jgi:hypothetical protein
VGAIHPAWLYAAIRAHNGNLDTLAKLFLEDAPLSAEVKRMLGTLFQGRKLAYASKGKKGAKRMFTLTQEQRLARSAERVKRLQRGELKLFGEHIPKLAPKIHRSFPVPIKRDRHGRMSQEHAILAIAAVDSWKPGTLEDFIKRRRGASRGGWRRWPSRKKAGKSKKPNGPFMGGTRQG